MIDRWRHRLDAFPVGRIVAVFTMLTMVPLVLLGYFAVTLSSDAVRDQVEARIRTTADISATYIQQHMKGLEELVGSYARRPSLIEALGNGRPGSIDRKMVELHLTDLERARPGISVTFVTDRSGRLLAIRPATPSIVGEDFSFRDWYRGAMSTKRPYISEAYESAAAGHPQVVAAAAPLWKGSGPRARITAIVVAAYGLDTIQKFADDFTQNQRVSLKVTDQRGLLVAASGAPSSLFVSERRDPAVDAALAGRRGLREEDTPEGEVLSSYAPVAGIGWTVRADVPASAALAPVENLRSTVIGIASLLAVVLAGGLLLLAVSLHARRRVARRLEESQQESTRVSNSLRLLLESSGEGIYGIDLEGLFTFVNKSACEAFGYEPEEMTGKNSHQLVHHSREDGSPYPVQDCPIFATMRDTDGCREDKEVLWHRDGTCFPVEYSSHPIVEDGVVKGAVVTFADITERRQSEALLLDAKNAAEEANRAKSDFLSRMSHELRTPLNAILGFGQLLDLDELSEEQHDSVSEILGGGRHLLSLIDEVLDISRIESGHLSLSTEPVRVQELADDSARLIGPLAAQRGIDITWNITCTDVHVMADKQRLQQVLLNLLSNAVKYNRPAGRITLSCEALGEVVVIHVSDTGPGISADKLPRIFEPFDRLGAEETDVEGTGLGLALSKRLVEAMAGKLSVSSDEEGTTFSVTLPQVEDPLERLEAELKREPRAAAQTESSHTILYIEDNLSNRKLIERVLSHRLNVKLLSAMQGRLGIDLAVEHVPEMILLDVNLPDLPGDEVLVRLKGDPRTASIPVVVISADATSRQIDRLLSGGAVAYLTKPINVDGLLQCIDKNIATRMV